MQDKINAVQQAQRPRTKKQLRSFLGLVGYYRCFTGTLYFAAMAVPVTDRTKKEEPTQVRWGDAEEMAFNTLKQKLERESILLQEKDAKKVPLAYASRKLLLLEQSCSVIEREYLAVVWGILKFELYFNLVSISNCQWILTTNH